jgi:hypothetical protein
LGRVYRDDRHVEMVCPGEVGFKDLLLRGTTTSARPVFLLGRSGVTGGVCLMCLADSALGEIVEGAAAENENGHEGEQRELLSVAGARAGRSRAGGSLGLGGGSLAESSGKSGDVSEANTAV